jgi:hypothetical protein
MANASLVPSLDADIHLVLCRFGRAGLTGSASRLISGEQWPSPNRARACRRSYSPSERPVMVPRASGIGRSALLGIAARRLNRNRLANLKSAIDFKREIF